MFWKTNSLFLSFIEGAFSSCTFYLVLIANIETGWNGASELERFSPELQGLAETDWNGDAA